MFSNKMKFAIVTTVIVLLRIADLVITYKYTPTLSNELNPLVSLGNLNWQGFITFQIVLLLIIIICWAYYIWGKAWVVTKTDLKYTDYIYYYFFNKLEPWSKRFFTFPKHIYPHIRLLTFVITLTSLIISGFAITNNLLLIFEIDFYERILINSIVPYFSFVLLTAIFVSANLFFTYEYRLYKRA